MIPHFDQCFEYISYELQFMLYTRFWWEDPP